MAQSSRSAEINALLAHICEQLHRNPDWKSEVDYVVSRKSGDTKLEKIFAYQGPDIDTVLLLIKHRETWTNHPMHFVSCGTGKVVTSSHPVLHAALHCLSSELHDVWGIILRRCRCMVLSMVPKQYEMTPEDVALQLAPSHPEYDGKTLLKKVKSFLSAGAKYEWREALLGRGVIFVLGKKICNDTWEIRLRKYNTTDDRSSVAIGHLKSTGIGAMASEYLAMRDAIIACMLMQALEVAMPTTEAWMAAQRITFGFQFPLAVSAHHQMWDLGIPTYYSDTGHFTR